MFRVLASRLCPEGLPPVLSRSLEAPVDLASLRLAPRLVVDPPPGRRPGVEAPIASLEAPLTGPGKARAVVPGLGAGLVLIGPNPTELLSW